MRINFLEVDNNTKSSLRLQLKQNENEIEGKKDTKNKIEKPPNLPPALPSKLLTARVAAAVGPVQWLLKRNNSYNPHKSTNILAHDTPPPTG